MKTLSRRDALRAGASALALAPIPAAAVAALPAAPTKSDAKLLALIGTVPALLDACDKAEAAKHEAHDRAEARLTPSLYEDVEREYRRRGIELRRAQINRIANERWERASRECGLKQAVARWRSLHDEIERAVERVYATRARTVAGIEAKQRLAVELTRRLDDSGYYEPETWGASVLRDLERLPTRAQS